MNIQALSELIEANVLTPNANLSREIAGGYACDLLSWVMAHGKEGMAWVTVQTHMNVIAVATLHDMSCVIIPENIKTEPDVIAKADEEGVAMLSTGLTTFEICGRMRASGVQAQ